MSKARNRRDDTRHRIHTPHAMVQRIGNIEMPSPIDHHRCRKIQQGVIGRAAVAAKTFFRRRAGHDIPNGPAQVGLLRERMRMDGVAFGKGIVTRSFRCWRWRNWRSLMSNALNASR